MKKIIVRRKTEHLDALSHLHPVLHRVYAARGIQSLSELDRSISQLLPYQNLLNIDLAVSQLAEAVISQKHIMIIGDFDADGATSTAVAVSALRVFGAQQVSYLVPNRFEYGYGLTPEIVAVAARSKPDVIITVDNGISSHAGVLAAKKLGIKVIITDHHLAPAELPMADAIINPQQPGDQFSSKNLAGVGVIFYVMLALRGELRNRNWFAQNGVEEPNMAQFLDLVALGTVADLVPLDYNNRIMVHHGVQRIRSGKARPGIEALFAVAGRKVEKIIATDLGFVVGPRLNAAGRLTDMTLGIECLLCSNQNRARELAVQLNSLNEERRLIEHDMQQHAFAILEKLIIDQQKLGICLYDETWHQGVIGLLASRIKDRYHRPTIVFAPGNNEFEIKGSARSIPGLHIRDLLEAMTVHHPELIDKFGGHAMAAGLSIKKEKYDLFCQAFDMEIQKHLNQSNLLGEIHTDGELAREDFNVDLAEQLREAGPWGQAYPEPLFEGRFKIIDQRLINNKHLKLTLGIEQSEKMLEGIAFNIDLKKWPHYRSEYLYAAYRLDINEYQGRKTLQLIIEQLEAI